MQGWIKLHRGLIDWEWYDHLPTKVLFIHLLLKANHKDNSYRGKIVKKGHLLTSRELLSKETGLTERQIRTALNHLKSTNEIAIKSNRQGTEIKVVKYSEYQETTNEKTNERPTNDQQATSNNNDKKEKNEEKYYYIINDKLKLTNEKYKKLLETYSPSEVDAKIYEMENYDLKKRSKYKSMYLTLNKWLLKDRKQQEEKQAAKKEEPKKEHTYIRDATF